MWTGPLLLGVAAGIAGGFFGIGGGSILIPALIYLFGMTQHQAQGTTFGGLEILSTGQRQCPAGGLDRNRLYRRRLDRRGFGVKVTAGDLKKMLCSLSAAGVT